ncbi:MAG TPA: competence protein CoiA family protein [Bacillales bacterium]|nr:competence protein CoiA family protein [Bacillales bacterium]
MLVAKKRDGTLFTLLGRREKRFLKRLRNREVFYCPICHEKVQMRLGDQRSWHFAHQKGTECSYEAESESAYHLQGKRLLYEWLVSQDVQVKLEPYLTRLKQRPDLLLNTSPYPTALEFQCSTIEPDLLTKRTRTFQKAGVLPIWILGGNRLKRIGTRTFQLAQMDWLTLRKASRDSSGTFLIYFCPDSGQICLLTDILPCSNSRILANPHFYPIHSFTLHDLYRISNPEQPHYPENWLSLKKQWRINAFRGRSRAHRYAQTLYRHLSMIPSAAGWPTPHLYQIETPCFLWQGWLFHHFYLKGPEDRPIRLDQVRKAFRALVQQNIFRVRSFPLITDRDETLPLLEYLQCLTTLGLLRQTNETVFQKKHTAQSPVTMEDFLHLDVEYFEKLSRVF